MWVPRDKHADFEGWHPGATHGCTLCGMQVIGGVCGCDDDPPFWCGCTDYHLADCPILD